jgi:hypothetical protein
VFFPARRAMPCIARSLPQILFPPASATQNTPALLAHLILVVPDSILRHPTPTDPPYVRITDFLAARMKPTMLDLHQCVILAAYILFQAKEHVDGCGGESQIAVLRHKGKSGLVS